MTSTDESPTLYWLQDSGAFNTLHINGAGLKYKESMVGYLVSHNNMTEWSAHLKNDEKIGMFPTMYRAQRALEDFYGNSKKSHKNVKK